MDAVETFTHAGLTVEIHYDQDTENPRDRDAECLSATLVMDHRRYTMPNEADDIYPLDSYTGWDAVEAAIREAYDVAVLVPVWGYDHGNLAIKAGERTYPFSDAWDSGQLGLAFVTREAMDSGWGAGSWDEAKALEVIQAEVAEYGQWANGECYGYVVKDKDDETLDSCWGYIGSEYVAEAAKEAAESERDWLVSAAYDEAQCLVEALDTPDVLVALAAAQAGVR